MPDISEFEEASELPERAPHTEWAKAEVVVGPDGGSLSTGVLHAPLDLASDWAGVLRGFGLDPDAFQVVDDTVRMSKWQQSKRLENGDRDTIWLWSYSARFVRRVQGATDLDVEALRKRVAAWRPAKAVPIGTGTPSTYVVCWADWQLGKSQGGGVEATLDRIEASFAATVSRLADLRKLGRNIEAVAVFNMGDPTESCLAGETEVITADGIRRLDDLASDGYATIKTEYGKWVEAKVRSFGTQRLYRIELDRCGASKSIFATAEHRWFAHVGNASHNGAKEELTTADLAPGRYLVSVFGNSGAAPRRAKCWRVVSVTETDRVEEVYCAQVPGTRSFALANDILTGNCDGQYASQLFSVELTQREQLNLALDCWLKGCQLLRPDVFGSVLCNHGEWTRRGPGERPVTTDSDNVSGYLADTLRRVLDGRPDAPTRWAIPHDEMVTPIRLSGVDVAFTHGHKIPSEAKELEWLRGQSIRLLRENGAEPRLWVTAHRHHVRVDDYGPWWRLQCPTLDGGSKYYTDTTGKWATPGTMTFLVGRHDERGWSDLAVL